MYVHATGAFVQAWGLLQRDAALLEGLERLRATEAEVARVPVHGDLRLDQFLLAENAFYVNDWEEFRLGDPARDVGAYVGEWLHRAVLRIPAQETDDAFSAVLTHEEVVARGSEELDRVLPLVSAFHRGYREGGGPDDDGLVVRATSYAGWHLIDRLIASTRESGRLSAIVRAAAGIGRTALLDPRSFVSTVGLGEAS
ncbi:Aminoglycoside phosphotransferase family protein OS=Streptomyces alboniger OX=132473 GN=CP975_34890 PE=4 SV=1 [Streptomyces alboniger]